MSVEAISAARKLQLAPRDKFVLIALADYANDQGEAWPGQGTLSDWTSYDRSTVNSALTALEAAGIITSRQTYRDDGGKSVKVYRLTFLNAPHVGRANKGHVADTDNPHVGESNKGMSATPTTPHSPGQHPHVGRANSKNRQEGTTNKEPPQEQARASKGKVPKPKLGDFNPRTIALPEHLSPDVWQRFVDHRDQLGKRLTEVGTRGILELLARHPLDADQMLRNTCDAGWTRVFPLDKPRDETRSGTSTAAWDTILDAARKGKPPDGLDPPAKTALAAIGGWTAVAYCPDHLLAGRRRQFLDAYTPTKTKPRPEAA